MYKLVYFDGKELEMTQSKSLKRMKELAEKNENIYQIVRLNRDNTVVWEREAPSN